MAMYTQVKTTAGYVGLNALEYIMQTVREVWTYRCEGGEWAMAYDSTSMLFYTPPPRSYSTPPTEAAQVGCYRVWVDWQVSLRPLPVSHSERSGVG